MEFDWKRALTYLRADVDYKRKLAILSVAAMLPFINVIVLGYGVEIYRGIVEGKKDEDVQPEFANAGDFVLKGLLSACIALGYAIIGICLSCVVALAFGSGAFTQAFTGGHFEMPVLLKLLIALIAYGVSVLFWAGFSMYCETVEMSRAFRVAEIMLRVPALGKSFLISVGCWCAFCYAASFLTGLLPIGWLGMTFCSLLVALATLVMVHIVAQIAVARIKPVLGDVVNVGYMEYSIKHRAALAAHEDEFGYEKHGGRKASHYADHRPDTTLTWSTDSDNPLDD